MNYETVLVTGAGGFIGSNLVKRQLSMGRRVIALDVNLSAISGLTEANLTRIEGDFTDAVVQKQALQNADLVVHLASAHLQVNVPEEHYWRVNVHSLRSFLDAAREAGVKRFLHISSVGVYGEIQGPPANEDSPCQPDLLYERTKYEGEKKVRQYYDESELPIVIVRPAWVYGPGCPRTAKLFRSVKKGRFFFVGSGQTLRHCVYIDDFMDALELCALQDAAIGQTFVIGDNEPVTLNHLMSEIASVSGAGKPKVHIPVILMKGLGLAAEAAFMPLRKEPPFSRRTIRFFTGNTNFDISRARNVLGFSPRYNVASGLREYARLEQSKDRTAASVTD